MERLGDWMQTYSGRMYWPLDPHADEVYIEDIAHALSNMCRYAGHCLNFYSVAEHSVHMSRYAAPADKKWALLHDASEAYITDIIRPLKPHLHNYYQLEALNMNAICERFDMDSVMPENVKWIDNQILLDERDQNCSVPPADWNIPGLGLGITLEFWTPKEAERRFLEAFYKLGA